MADEKHYPQDVEGYEYVTNALMETVNIYPGLEDGEQFVFTMMEPEEGLSIVASSGSSIIDSRESIIGHVWQECLYPFTAVYRVSGLNQNRKIQVKEWLDTFSRWLSRQPVNINGEQVVLAEWPKLTDGRVIRDISRQTPSYLYGINEDKSETWVISLQIQYRNEFDR